MRQRYEKFNNKRRIKVLNAEEKAQALGLIDKVGYGGNPEHKRNPGDFGLTPPSDPRPAKSLCDTSQIFEKSKALALLKEGLRRGLFSDRSSGNWPKNIWAVTDDGIALEAQLENSECGIYHGYPMPDSDSFASEVKRYWREHGDG